MKGSSVFRFFSTVLVLVFCLIPVISGAACTGSCSESQSEGNVTVTFSGNGSFTPPSGVTSVTVEAWGGGGGGAGNSGLDAGGGGGGGAYASRTVPVTPGSSYSVTVGTGGDSGQNGGNSIFTADTSVNNVRAAGGAGSNNDEGAMGGQVADSLGTDRFAGGNGGNGETTGFPFGRNGGGGGGSATASANGGNGANGSAGGAGGTGEGNGGSSGNPGSVPGGGGGGGDGGFGNNPGGAGADGRVIVRYTLPLQVGRCENFENGLSNWTIDASGGGEAGTNEDTSSPTSPSESLFTRAGEVSVTSNSFDTSAVNSLVIEAWIRRGDDSFSENPDNGEDLVIQYLDDTGTWKDLETFDGDGQPGQIHDRFYIPDSSAQHSGFQLRIKQLAGNSGDFDYWHVDEICFFEASKAYYRMDEEGWNGTSGEVTNFIASEFDGTAINGADTNNTNPARPGNPGTCGYGDFEAADDEYVQVNNISEILNGTASLAFWVKTTQAGNDTGWQAPGIAGVEEAGGQDDIFWGWIDNSGNIGISVGNDFNADQKSVTEINDGDWHHVVLTRNAISGATKVYVDGNFETDGNSGSGVIGNTFSSLGRIEDTDDSPEYLDGELDEVRIYSGVLTDGAVTQIYNDTHPCASFLDHYAISHDGTGVTCLADDVTITAHDTSDNAVDPGNVTIDLSTTTNRGDWSAIISGTGTLNDGTQGDGAASYTFPGGETSVTLSFNYTNIPSGDTESFFFDVTDGTASDLGDGDPEDPQMTFARTGFQFVNQTDGNNTIPTQIAGKPSDTAPNAKSLAIRAVRSSDDDPSVCVAEFANESKTLEFDAECRDPATCAGQNISINGNTFVPNDDNSTTGTADYSQPVTLNFDGNGVAPLVLNYFDAGLMQLHARYEIPLDDGSGTPSGDYMLGSSNNYVVRPFGFDVSVSGNPGATDASGGVLGAAGADFDVTTTAVLWQQADDGNNDGVPDGHDASDTDAGNNADLGDNAATPNFGQESSPATATLTARLDQPGGGVAGTLNGGTGISGFSGGSATTTVQYDEVGIIELRADTADYLTGGQDVTGLSGYVGRFIPDRFDVTANTPVFADGCGSGDFTYQDQNFYYDIAPILTVTALNTNGNTTNNYGSAFWKLSTTLGNRSYIDQTSATASFVAQEVSNVALAGDTDFDGQGTLSQASGSSGDIFRYSRNTPEAPFDADVDTTFPAGDLTDSDSVCYDPDDDGSCDAFTIPNITGTELRFGRLRLTSAVGSELLPLPVPMRAQYYDGTAFVVNTADSCTGIAPTDLSLTSTVEAGQTDGDVDVSNAADCADGTTTASVANNPMSNGESGLSFSAPGESCVGDVDITLDLDALGMGHLRFDWDDTDGAGDGPYDDNPAARASFGIFAGQREFIYRREPW